MDTNVFFLGCVLDKFLLLCGASLINPPSKITTKINGSNKPHPPTYSGWGAHTMYYGYGGGKPGTTHKKLFSETNKHHLRFVPRRERTQDPSCVPTFSGSGKIARIKASTSFSSQDENALPTAPAINRSSLQRICTRMNTAKNQTRRWGASHKM